jgi:hypothetical protein
MAVDALLAALRERLEALVAAGTRVILE